MIVTTDDGSAGEKGLVTAPLKRMAEAGELDHSMAIGPAIMMKFCVQTAKEHGVPCTVSLNPIMVDGTGMCGACRVSVGGETKFGCVDGPDFDGWEVDFEELMSRQRIYVRRRATGRRRVLEGVLMPPVDDHAKAPGSGAGAEKPRHKPSRAPRTPMPERDAAERAGDFDEVALGYTEEQAVAEANRCLQCKNATCIEGCPVNIDIKSFIGHIIDGDYADGVTVLKERNALPAVCGRVCPQEEQCEASCVLARKGEPVAIGRLERWLGDFDLACEIDTAAFPRSPRRAASDARSSGSGPAGLACAGELARLGHERHRLRVASCTGRRAHLRHPRVPPAQGDRAGRDRDARPRSA